MRALVSTPVALALLLGLLCGPGRALTRQQVYERTAPAMVLVAALGPGGTRADLRFAPGVIVSPAGVLVTSESVVAHAAPERIFVFRHDAGERAPEDQAAYLFSHLSRAQPAALLETDREAGLSLLALPERPAPYAHVELGDPAELRLGQEVAIAGSPRGLTFTLHGGTVRRVERQRILIEGVLPAGAAGAGAPVLDRRGLLVGVLGGSAEDTPGLGTHWAVSAGTLREHLGRRAPRPAPDDREAAAPPSGPEPRPRHLLDEVLRLFQRRAGPVGALRLYCQFLAAGALQGRAAVAGVDEVGPLDDLLRDLRQREGPEGTARLEAGLPLALVDGHGVLWRRRGGPRYVRAFAVSAWAVDDVSGRLYAADLQRRVYLADESDESFARTALDPALALQASGGTVYSLGLDRGLYEVRSGRPRRILSRPVAADATILGTQGMLYLLEEGSLYRYQQDRWAEQGRPLQEGVAAFAASGRDFYGLDGAGGGRIFAGAEGRYIDRGDRGSRLFVVGKRLLVLGPGGRFRGYRPETGAFSTFERSREGPSAPHEVREVRAAQGVEDLP